MRIKNCDKKWILGSQMINFFASLFRSPVREPAPVKIRWWKAHSWQLPDGACVNLLCNNVGDIHYESIQANGITNRSRIPTPPKLSFYQCIAHLKILKPNILPDGTVEFLAAIKEAKSQFDSEIVVNDDKWALTLVDSGTISINPMTWCGHACLLVEGTSNGYFFTTLIHLVKSKTIVDGHEMGNVVLKINTTCNPNKLKQFRLKINKKSVTWVRSRIAVQQIFQKVVFTISEQNHGRPQIPMDLRGQGSILVKEGVRIDCLDPASNRIVRRIAKPHNCFTYLRSILKLAGIKLWKPRGTQFVVSPYDSIGERTQFPTSCEVVKVRCFLFQKLISIDIDITQDMHHSELWYIIPDDRAAEHGFTAVIDDITFSSSDVKVTKTHVNRRFPNERSPKKRDTKIDISAIIAEKVKLSSKAFFDIVQALRTCKMPRNDVPVIVEPFPLIEGNAKSFLEIELGIDPEHWVVTLNKDKAIIIEGIENGQFFVKKVSFDGATKRCNLEQITNFDNFQMDNESLSFGRSKSEVQKMLTKIESEIAREMAPHDNPISVEAVVPSNADAPASADIAPSQENELNGLRIAYLMGYRLESRAARALKSASDVLSEAGIFLQTFTDIWAEVIQASTCERVLIKCIFIRGLFEETIDVTQEIYYDLQRQKLPGRWQASTWDEMNLSGNPERIAAVVDVPFLRENNFFQVPQTVLPLKVPNKGVINLDITYILGRKLSADRLMEQILGYLWKMNKLEFYASRLWNQLFSNT